MVGQHRSIQRRCPRPELAEDVKLRRRLRRFAREHPRLGWRKAHPVLCREGWQVNHKKLRRLWREEGLVPPTPAKRKVRRPGTGQPLARTEYPNYVWAIDFQFDETSDGRPLKLANIIDGRPREAPDGQRARAHCVGAQGSVPAERRRHVPHRARLPAGEPLDGVVQRAPTRRVPQHQRVRVAHGAWVNPTSTPPWSFPRSCRHQ